MSIESFIKKKKRNQDTEKLDFNQFLLDNSERMIDEFLKEVKPKLVKDTQDIIKENINNLVKNVRKGDMGETGLQGLPGATGLPGDEGKPGKEGREGKPGKNGTDGLNGKDGKDGTLTTPDEIADKLNTLVDAVEPNVIKGFETIINQLKISIREAKKLGGGSGGGGGMGTPTHEQFSVGVTTTSVTLTSNVAASGNAIWVYYNGQFLVKDTHYTVSGKVVTFTETFQANTNIDITYIRT